jgi:hypothetical protein
LSWDCNVWLVTVPIYKQKLFSSIQFQRTKSAGLVCTKNIHATDLAEILINAGAKQDITNNKGELPLDLAQTEEMRKILK